MVDYTTHQEGDFAQETENPGTTQNYIEALTNLKANTVSKELYEQAVAENKTLLDSLINGKASAAAEETAEERPSLEELKNALFKPEKELNNLEYVKRTLAYRDALLEETGEDCFVAHSTLNPDFDEQREKQKAQNVADVFRQCVESCDGDSDIFTAKLQNRMIDNYVPPRKKNK